MFLPEIPQNFDQSLEIEENRFNFPEKFSPEHISLDP